MHLCDAGTILCIEGPEVDYVADRVCETVERLRELSPLYEMAKEGVDLKSVKWAAEAH